MPVKIVNGVEVDTGTAYSVPLYGGLFVAASGILGSTDGDAVVSDANAGDFFASVAGTIVADSNGIVIQAPNTGTQHDIRVLKTGVITTGYNAIEIANGDFEIFNEGTIAGRVNGINALLQFKSSIINSGSISGWDGITAGGLGGLDIVNSGSITGTKGTALDLGNGIDRVINSGRITGNVELYAGDDRYEARDGGSVNGIVYGGDGIDTFVLGAAYERFDGGSGNDRLFNNSEKGARISLRDDHGTGVSLRDSYVSIERVYGSVKGRDEIIGSDGDNWLYGRGGHDTIRGFDGKDLIEGGAARITLSAARGTIRFCSGPRMRVATGSPTSTSTMTGSASRQKGSAAG